MFILLIIGQLSVKIAEYYMADIIALVASSDAVWQKITINLIIFIILMVFGRCIIALPLQISAKFIPQIRTISTKDIFNYVNKHSISYFCEEMSGNIANKVGQLSNGLMDLFSSLLNIGYTLFMLTITSFILSFQSLYLGIFMLIWVIISILLAAKIGGGRAVLAKDSGHQKSVVNGVLVDSISNYSEVKSFANFGFEQLNLLKHLRRLRKAESKERSYEAKLHLLGGIYMAFSIASFVAFSLYCFSKKYLDATSFIYSNSLFTMISGLVFQVSWFYNNMSRIYGTINSALETLSIEPNIMDSPQAKELKIKKAEINFENVSFSYTNKDELFSNLNITIKAGEKIGLVGESGAGKSTFIKLLSRYYDANSGEIKINGISLKDIKQDSLHKNIATIPQDISLFNRSLYDNIRYGSVKASREEIIKAAKLANADEFITAFQDGYNTKVGERGVVLSGGERQRIAIARAILKKSPILIFDEATSSLDSQSEKLIQKSLKKLMNGKTVIAVAHRLSTLREMDRILVFEKGKIVEDGSHLSLLRKKGKYAKLYKMQIDGFLQ